MSSWWAIIAIWAVVILLFARQERRHRQARYFLYPRVRLRIRIPSKIMARFEKEEVEK